MADPVLSVVHRTPGRVRLHAPAIIHQPSEARRIADAVAALPGVSKVEPRPATGSVVVFHLNAWETLAADLAEALGGEIEETPETPGRRPHAMESATDFVAALDETTARAFGRRTDLSELVFLGLLAAGAVQLARGQVFGPAATLIGQALNLAATRGSRLWRT